MALTFHPAPLTSGARHYCTLGGVRLYLMHARGRAGGHYATTSPTGGRAGVIAFPDGAAFRSQTQLRAALNAADARAETVTMAPGVGVMLSPSKEA